MTSACLINLMTNDVVPESEGPPTIDENGCFHFSTSLHGSDEDHYTMCARSCRDSLLRYITFVTLFKIIIRIYYYNNIFLFYDTIMMV